MINNIIGNAPNQVPTNADLGELAYQDSYWVRVGNITVDYHTTITGNTTVLGNLILSNSSSNVLLSGGADIAISTGSNIYTDGNILLTTGNIQTDGNIVVGSTGNVITSGNINVSTGNISTNSNINVTSTGNIRVQSLIITQGNIFCNVATLSSEANTVITRGYVDSQLVVFGF